MIPLTSAPEERKMFESILSVAINEYRINEKINTALKECVIQLVWEESNKDKYKNIDDNTMSMCEAKAYEECCRHAQNFNSEVSNKPISYLGQLIRCAFVNVIKKQCCYKIIKEELE
mgnify:CR=1 FL=1